MENPRLTFTTPTILAGDRSLVSLVAHELAHSWSGNLVTNATWSDFWLNEGFTVYLERRILEKVYGPERADMEAVLGRRELDREMAGLPESDRVLHIDLNWPRSRRWLHAGAVRKRRAAAANLEQAVGRERFDDFLRAYFDHFAFRSITTAEFLEYLHRRLPATVPVEEWIVRPGIPAGAAEPHSDAFAESGPGHGWNTHHWLHFLRSQEQPDMARLDSEFHLTESRQFRDPGRVAADGGAGRLRAGLAAVGGVSALGGTAKVRKGAVRGAYENAGGRGTGAEDLRQGAAGYHPITQRTVDGIVAG